MTDDLKPEQQDADIAADLLIHEDEPAAEDLPTDVKDGVAGPSTD